MAEKKSTKENVKSSFRLIRFFWPQIVREKGLVLLSLGGLALTLALQVVEPWPLKYIYDSIFHVGGKHGRVPLPLADGFSPHAVIAVAALSIVTIVALGAAAEYFCTVYLARATSRIAARVRARLFSHVANHSIAFHDRTRIGDLITRVTNDIERMREVAVTAALPFLTNTLTLLAMLGVMFWMNWGLAATAAAAFPAFFAAVLHISGRVRAASRAQRSREGAVAAITAETMSSIRIVQAFSLQRRFLEVFSVDNKASLRAGVKTQRLSAGLERTAEVLVVGATATVLWGGAHQVLKGKLTPGDLVVFVSYLRVAFKPLRHLAKYLGQMAKAMASADRVLELMTTVPEVRDAPGAVPAGRFTGHIRFENVSFEYAAGKPVLREVSFEIKPGQHVAVLGHSGSGKSTLASLILRFHDPKQGRILIDGRDIRAYKLESLRAQIGIVMQDSTLFGASVRDNIAFGTADADEDRVVEAARLANAHEFIEQMPKRYDTVLGERGATVSGGQRQRIAIARAAVRRAPIMILDEPATGLDSKNEYEVAKALDRLTKNLTTLLITHSARAAKDADLVIYLAEGRIVESGRPAELLARGGKYAELYYGQTNGVARGDDFALRA